MGIDFRVRARVPRTVSKDAPYVCGITTFSHGVRIWVNLRKIYARARQWHRGHAWMVEYLVRTIEHEYVHAMLPDRAYRREEKLANAFELAGAWARR